MVVNNPLIRPAISWGKRGIRGVGPLDSHDVFLTGVSGVYQGFQTP